MYSNYNCSNSSYQVLGSVLQVVSETINTCRRLEYLSPISPQEELLVQLAVGDCILEVHASVSSMHVFE